MNTFFHNIISIGTADVHSSLNLFIVINTTGLFRLMYVVHFTFKLHLSYYVRPTFNFVDYIDAFFIYSMNLTLGFRE